MPAPWPEIAKGEWEFGEVRHKPELANTTAEKAPMMIGHIGWEN